LILLAILPPLLAVGWWKYSAWRAEQYRRRAAARQQFVLPKFVLRIKQPMPAPVIVTAAQRAARVQAKLAEIKAQADARFEAILAAREAAQEASRVEQLQRMGYLPAHAAPRIQPPPTAPAKAGA